MSIRRWNVLGFFVCLLVSVPAGQARQQTVTNAVIAGTIVDHSGGIIPGAAVALEQQGKTLLTTTTDSAGKFRFERVSAGEYQVRASLSGFKTTVMKTTVAGGATIVDVRLVLEVGALTETVNVMASSATMQTTVSSLISSSTINGLPTTTRNITIDGVMFLPGVARLDQIQEVPLRAAGEHYAPIVSNPFRLTSEHPLSTFAADVDTASYTNVRRFLSRGELPPPDAVRVEELINYFRFAYPEPRGGDPVSITTEIGDCPWAPDTSSR